MLTIPNSIKTLFKTDGTKKNFRVQFPNGELPDITNENIVRESVHFTESICSQSTFRFGLAEASVIEFETVGIGNMYGYTISCSYEIDTSSLSASEIASIQSDPGDGELVLASASDIGFGFYRVPLGVFRVERCPRNHGAMTHRQVTGYGMPRTSSIPISPIQESYFSLGTAQSRASAYSADLIPFIIGNLGYSAPAFVDERYTRSVLMPATSMTSGQDSGTVVNGGVQLRVVFSYLRARMGETATISDVWGWDDGGFDYSEIKSWLETTAPSYGFTNEHIARAFEYCGVFVQHSNGNLAGSFYTRPRGPAHSFYAWPGASESITFTFPTSITINILQSGVVLETYEQTGAGTPTVFKWTPTSEIPFIEVLFPPTGTATGIDVIYNTYIGAVETLDTLFSGYLELSGVFGKQDRKGSIEDFALSPSSPLAISPGDYDECWWDEYDVSPIGTVTVTYRNGEEGEATASVTLGAGASLYDMTDNEVLKNLSTADLDSITTLLSGDFAQNAQNVGFTPIEMTMQGWPWLEAGDALQITAEDGTVVNTYALRVEMSGIQHLMSDITAEGGEIIGEV